jgi:uncharacterized membrane protein
VTAPAPSRPKPSTARLLGVDAARGIALIGMMAVHVTPSLGPDGTVSTAYVLASGRASALFAVLAGVGLALASGGRTPPRGRPLGAASLSTAARAGVLLVVGLAVGAFDSGVAVILVYYAVLFAVAIPFLGLGPRVLLPLAVAWALVTPVLSQALRQGWAWESPGNPTFESLIDPGGLLADLLLTGYYPVLQWTAYLLLGLGLGRLDLRSVRTPMLLLAGGAAVAVAARLTSWVLLEAGGLARLQEAGAGAHPIAGRPLDVVLQTSFYGTTPTTTWWWLAVSAPHSAAPADLLHTMGIAVAVLGVMLMLARGLGRGLWPLAAIGSMTLTLYSLHVILLATALPRETPQVLLWHVVVALVVAVPWRTFVGRGPLEAVAARAAAASRAVVARRSVPAGTPSAPHQQHQAGDHQG